MDELSAIVDSGSHVDLLQAIASLNERKRKSAALWFTAQWKERRAVPHPRDADEPLARWMRLLVGLTAAADDPKKALAIPVSYWGADFPSRMAWDPFIQPDAAAPEALAALAQALIGHGPEWCTQYLALVTDAKKPRAMYLDPLLLVLRAHGLPWPATPVLPLMWAAVFYHLLQPALARHAEGLPVRRIARFELNRSGDGWQVRAASSIDAATIPEALRTNPDTPALLNALLDHRDAALALSGRYPDQQAMDLTAAVVAQLVADGTLDGPRLAEKVIAALSRGDSVGCQRLQTRLLRSAQPGPALARAHSRVLANLLASASAPAASLAQELLLQADTVDANDPLPSDLFVDTCQMVFGRKEKGLREVQLAWARGRAARPATAASAVNGLTAALLCPDHAVQKAAVADIASAWPALDGPHKSALLAQVEASQGVLDSALYASLWRACTGSEAPSPEKAPARMPPRRTGLEKRPFESVPDLDAPLPADIIRAFQTYQTERSAEAHERAVWVGVDALNRGNAALAREIGTRLDDAKPFGAPARWHKNFEREMSWVAHRRIVELKHALSLGRPQPFISRPSWSHGAISPTDLANRLGALADSGATALPVDLLVALLRTEAADAPTLARLREIASPQAQVAADFLAAGGVAQLTTRWLVADGSDDIASSGPARHDSGWYREGHREVCVALKGAAHPPAIDGAPLEWAAGFEAHDAPFVYEFDMVPEWLTPMLPTHAEALAALHLWGFRRAGLDLGTDGGKAVAVKLPLFTAAHGPAGPALHLAVFYAMSANDAPVRLVGSDGMATLLLQGRWQDTLAGELLTECLRCGSVKASRLAGSLAQVREAGETEAVWALLHVILPTALSLSPPPSGLADLLSLAAEAASELGVKESIPELVRMVAAIKGKPNKLQSQAQRLHAVLNGSQENAGPSQVLLTPSGGGLGAARPWGR